MTDLIDTQYEPSADPLTPLLIAPDTYVIQAIHGEGEGPMAVHMNSMLIRGQEPIVVDTGTPIDRDAYLQQLTSLVDPQDVRWIFISHDDVDHYGNVDVLMDMCPNATMIATWFLTQRMSAEGPLPPMERWRWPGIAGLYLPGPGRQGNQGRTGRPWLSRPRHGSPRRVRPFSSRPRPGPWTLRSVWRGGHRLPISESYPHKVQGSGQPWFRAR